MAHRAMMIGVALALAGMPQRPATAQTATRPAQCELTVDGKRRIAGVCQYRPTGGGGFQISAGDYFAYLSVVGPSLAEASWNGSDRASHAQVPLGQLRRDGACWINRRARICARALSADRQKAIVAGQPGGVTLYPEGAPYACLGTDGPVAIGKPVSLRDCRSPRDKIFTVARDGSIGLDRRPGLCLAIPAGKAAALTIASCTPQMRWTIAASGPSPIRSAGGQCLVVPQIDVPNARFPFAVRAQPCAGASARAIRFLIERE